MMSIKAAEETQEQTDRASEPKEAAENANFSDAYYETVAAGISRADLNNFEKYLIDWAGATSYQEMFDIAIRISEGKYNGE
jgi:hypothetical protein